MPPHLRGSQKAPEPEKALSSEGLQAMFQVEHVIQALSIHKWPGESGSNRNVAKKKTTKKAAKKNAPEILPQIRGHRTTWHTTENANEVQSGRPQHSYPSPHRLQESEQDVPLQSARVIMQEVEEDEEERPFVASPLPPSSPHTLEGPDSSPLPSTPSTPIRATPDVSFSSVPGLPTSAQSLMLSEASDSGSSPSSAKDSSRNADDVWSFYIEEGNCHVCKLCHGGDKHKKNGKDKIYSIKTGTTGLRYHLIKDHLRLWVAACDKMGVSVKGAGIRAAERFRHKNSTAEFKEGPLPIDFAVPDYSHDAFVDAIVEWIITDDQV
ncbi:hypothetical protein EDD18DRAFT_1114615 [Armillaria luteobubalina]|uniref:BED-type domain-containing protein n=1 Tax=Armillaria luteobubalina TaxID=153913 RepID=A0AA39P5J1_9AGAR|nr:hypothetical protein EDD18DRAFT_1114615 [Armillaria luteobubalina]